MIQIKNRFTGELIRELETLRRADLRRADLRGADLQVADLRGANLQVADLRGADLRGADLQVADLRGANLRGADLRGADLQVADLRGADLRGADLQDAAVIVSGLEWPVYITNGHVRVGCQAHDLSTWENFTDDEISEVSYYALDFWNANKTWILATCKSLTKGD